ncbi:hypothetical protein [Pseudophaeobacter leonis]|uniref:hypothetical protein n=1 Tax=Pseudophaeobacter leonis TaxID=1144477 RepID=UPI0009F585E3|nr:hypothetical protein [Pseudophaeobacter leonis]
MDNEFRRKRCLSERGAAIARAFQLHYQAELAEVLLAEPGSMVKISPMARILSRQKEQMPRRLRRKLVQQLMSQDVKTRRTLSSSERVMMKRVVDPKAKTPISERSEIKVFLEKAMQPYMELKAVKKGSELYEILMAFLADFYCIEPLKPEEKPRNIPGIFQVPSPDPQPTLVPYRRLRMMVERVVSRDTTNGEAGADEISISGAMFQGPLTDPNNPQPPVADPVVIPPVAVGQFRRNEVIEYNPDRVHAEFDLTGMQNPYLVSVLFTMAETDPSGGFGTFMSDLVTELRPNIGQIFLEVFGALAMGTVSGVVGAGFGALAGPVGAVIGAVVGTIIGLIGPIYILITNWQNYDDIFDINDDPLLG